MNCIQFDNKLYKKLKRKVLNSKSFKVILKKYRDPHNLISGKLEYWGYYIPILTVIYQLKKDIKGKKILEIGCSVPVFLEYLRFLGAEVYGIDIEPYITNNHIYKMNIEDMNKKFIKEHKGSFDIIYQRLTFSKLYDEEHELKKGKPRFKNKNKILKTINTLLRPNGVLILLDDRGSMFSLKQFSDNGFAKCLFEVPVMFTKKVWNVVTVYRKAE